MRDERSSNVATSSRSLRRGVSLVGQGQRMDKAALLLAIAAIRENLHRVPDAGLQGAFASRLGVLQRSLSTLPNDQAASVADALRLSKQVLDLRDQVLGATRAGAA